MIATWVRERMKDCFIPMPCLFVGPSVYSFVICLSIHLSTVCLSVLPVHLSVCVCLSVCFLWVHVCKVTLCELYLYCTGWGCGRLTAWPCSSLRWPGDFLAYNQIKKSLASQGKKQCPNYHTSRSQAHLIWICCDGRLKVRNFLTLFCLSQDI